MFRLTPYERSNFDVFNFFNDIEKDLWSVTRTNTFRTDIKDEGDKFVLEAEMPGFDKSDIKINIDGNSLTLCAERSESAEEKGGENHGYIRRERSYGAYERSFNISNITADKIEAEYKNGLLVVDLPKKSAQVPQTKTIDIR